jgi:DNA (cytosine-5)-methyltransferase 1
MRPRLLDLFCGAGGCSVGYHRAGFDVIGVDINPQPNYPFEFHQADALTFPLDGFDAIHASPPCQDYSAAMRHFTTGYPQLIDPIRDRLVTNGAPWVIENVAGAPLPRQDDLFGATGVELCGTMFGLRVLRHRLFETSFPIPAPRGCDHSQRPMNPHNSESRKAWREILGPEAPIERRWREEMGVGWMNGAEGREAVPPAFTQYIGAQLMEQLVLGATP